MTTKLKAIDTIYNGYKFRSRLEARWAIFFDCLGIKYQYEPEGYDLGEAGYYLPDFWLPDHNIFVEVKPTANITPSERNKAAQLVTQSGKKLLMVFDCIEGQEVYLYFQSNIDVKKPWEITKMQVMSCEICNCLGGY